MTNKTRKQPRPALQRAAQAAHDLAPTDRAKKEHFKLMRREHERALLRIRAAEQRPDQHYSNAANSAAEARISRSPLSLVLAWSELEKSSIVVYWM